MPEILFFGENVTRLLIIGLGGFFGAVTRYLVAGWVQALSHSINFPYGTLAVNVIGSFILGFLVRYAFVHNVFSPEIRLLIFIGFLGAFTTFSTFSNETFNLFADGATTPALLNIVSNVLFGLVAVWLGQTLAFVLGS
jgi:CrcB protein